MSAGCNEFYKDSRANNIHETAINHMIPYHEMNFTPNTISVDNIAFPEVPSPFKFFSTDKVAQYKDAVTPVGGSNYVGWNAQMLARIEYDTDEQVYDYFDNTSRQDGEHPTRFGDAYGTTGKCIVMALKEPY
jgi:hypothetical protein